MKKFIIFIFAVGLFVLSGYEAASADTAIFVKGSFLKPFGNVNDYDVTYPTGGVFIWPRVHEFPYILLGTDYFCIEKKQAHTFHTTKSAISVTGLHIDFYLLPPGANFEDQPYIPAVGFGPVCNIYGRDEKGVKVGADFFVSFDINMGNRASMVFEGRYKQLEFTEKRIALQLTVGFLICFDNY